MGQVVADLSDIKHVLSQTKNELHEIEVATAPLTVSAARGDSSTSNSCNPREPELAEEDQKIQNTLQEWEAAISEAVDRLDAQPGQPCNVVEQPPVTPSQTSEPEKSAPKLQSPPWTSPVALPVTQPGQEDPHEAAEGRVELSRHTYEGPARPKARVPSATSATSGSSSTSRCRHPWKLEPVQGFQMTQTLQGKLHEWEAAGSEALDGFDTQSRQPCNVVEQSPVSLLRTARPDKHTHALKLPASAWRGQTGPATPPGTQSWHEDAYDAAEDVIELLRYAYEGPEPMNLQHLRGLEYHFVDLCQRVEVQLGRLLRLDPDAQASSRLELFACSARLMGALGTTMPDMLSSSVGSSPRTPRAQQRVGHVQQNGHGSCGLRYAFEL